MNGSGELAHDKLSTSALDLLTPTMRTTENIATYHDQITAVSNKLSNEKGLDPAGNPIEKQMWGKGRSHLYGRVEPSDTVKRLIGCVDGHGAERLESTLVKY